MKRLLTLTGVLLLLFYVTGVYGAGVEKKIYYEKKTTLSYPKKYTIRFSLWNDPTSTAQSSMVWSEEKEITLTTAKVRTYLGDTSPLDNVDFSEQLYVQVERKKADGTYVMIGTRDKFSVVPYAMWSANVGAGSGLDADTVDGVHGNQLALRAYNGTVPAGQSVTIEIPHYTPFTLHLGSGWPHFGGVAFVQGFENDSYVAITYIAYNGDGTSSYGGAECYEGNPTTLLTFGNGGYIYTVQCPGEASGPHNLVLTATGLELRYTLMY